MQNSRALHALLLATVGLPAMVFTWGTRDGEVAFVLFRDPKLAALRALGWTLLAVLAWRRPGGLRVADIRGRLRRPAWAFLGLFLAWGLITALWVEVPQNLWHELGQYALLLLLALALDTWSDRDPEVPWLVELGVVVSLGVASAVGMVQAVVPIPILSPIDPHFAASDPSFLGYKNPMALAVVGQIFLLGRFLLGARPGRRAPLAFLLAAELAYLVSLKSRTAWVALAGAAVLLLLLVLKRQGPGRWLVRPLAGGALAVVLFGAALAADPDLRWRAASVSGYLARPASFLESDRGTYLLNTLNMVRHHPLGVGLGDWQTQYPLYRRVQRSLYFSDTVQVRKAHSDPVQVLGETGWPGLVLWLGFLGALWVAPIRCYLRTGEPAVALAAAQVMVLSLAMLTDSLVDHPYGKLLLVLIAFIAVRTDSGRVWTPREPTVRSAAEGRWRGRALAVALSLAAAGAAVSSAALLWKSCLTATATDLYLEVLDSLGQRPAPRRLDAHDRELLARAVLAGERAARLPGYVKESCDDLLLLAHAESLLSRRKKALSYARESLRLHPYNPSALGLMALLARHPAAASRWRRAHEHVLEEATHGFEGRYPGVHLRRASPGQ